MAFWKKKEPATQSIMGMIGGRSASTRLDSAQVLRYYAKSPWLLAVTSRIATAAASIPISAYQATAKAGPGSLRAARKDWHGAGVKMVGAGVLKIIDHPALDLLDADGGDIEEATHKLLDMTGRAYWFLRMGSGIEPELLLPDPSVVTKIGGDYQATINGRMVTLPASQVVVISTPNPADFYGAGVGYGGALADEITADEQAAKRTIATFDNASLPSAIITVEGITVEQAKQLKHKMAEQHKGVSRHGSLHVTGQRTSVNMLDSAFKDLGTIEVRKFERDTFIQVFGVPPEILGIIENSNRATITGAEYIFLKYVILPRVLRMRKAVDQLIQILGGKAIAGFESFIPEDNEFRLEVFKAAPGAFTIGNWKRLAGLEATQEEDATLYAPAASAPAVLTEKKNLKIVKAITTQTIAEITAALEQDALYDATIGIWEAEAAASGQAAINGVSADMIFNIKNPAVIAHLENYGSRMSTLVDETTKENINRVLQEGVNLGEGTDALAKRVRGVFEDATKHRSEAIARTEVRRSSTFTRLEGWRQSGAVEGKQWIWRDGPNTRPSHMNLHLVTVGLDEQFKLAGEMVDGPGQGSVAEENINCRCSLVAVMPKLKSLQYNKGRKEDEAEERWVQDAIKGYNKGFAVQEKAVIKVLYSV